MALHKHTPKQKKVIRAKRKSTGKMKAYPKKRK